MSTSELHPALSDITPSTPQEWIQRAAEVAAILAVDAAERDRAGATPYDEVQLLKDSGLVTLLGPAEHGGGGQTWPTAYQVIRTVAAADGSIGQLLGYHLPLVLGRAAGRAPRADRRRRGARHDATSGSSVVP